MQRRIQNPAEHLRSRFCENSQQFSAVNYFRRKLHLRCSTGFWIRLCNELEKSFEWLGNSINTAELGFNSKAVLGSCQTSIEFFCENSSRRKISMTGVCQTQILLWNFILKVVDIILIFTKGNHSLKLLTNSFD